MSVYPCQSAACNFFTPSYALGYPASRVARQPTGSPDRPARPAAAVSYAYVMRRRESASTPQFDRSLILF
jgi:hypothetical protein